VYSNVPKLFTTLTVDGCSGPTSRSNPSSAFSYNARASSNFSCWNSVLAVRMSTASCSIPSSPSAVGGNVASINATDRTDNSNVRKAATWCGLVTPTLVNVGSMSSFSTDIKNLPSIFCATNAGP